MKVPIQERAIATNKSLSVYFFSLTFDRTIISFDFGTA